QRFETLVTSVSALLGSVTGIPSTIIGRLSGAGPRLTAAERKVADVIAADLDGVAFATVAELARRAGTSGPTVMRLAVKLGYSGFAALQDEAQSDMARRLRPASERIRERRAPDLVTRVAAAEYENVQWTFERIDASAFRRATERLADRNRRVLVLSGEATRPAGLVLASGLETLRDGVHLASGSDVDLARRLAHLGRRDVVVAMDLRRYERWVVRGAEQAAANHVDVIAVSDSLVSPL